MSDPAGKDDGRLKGWSQRKLAAKRQKQTVEKAVEESVPDVPETPVEDPEVIAALPSLDDITDGSDITAFFAKGVPAKLKNAALRKLWQASPAVRDYLDPAVDYAWDWNAPGGVPGGGGVLSEHSVAKMMKDLIAKPSKDIAEDIEETGQDTAAQIKEPAPDKDPDKDIVPVAVRRDAPDVPGTTAKDAPDKARNETRLPLRRHGGARPE